MDKTIELLLTVLALSQEGYRGPMSRAIPERLMPTLRTARKKGYVYVDDAGMYLEEEDTILLDSKMGPRPFG